MLALLAGKLEQSALPVTARTAHAGVAMLAMQLDPHPAARWPRGTGSAAGFVPLQAWHLPAGLLAMPLPPLAPASLRWHGGRARSRRHPPPRNKAGGGRQS